MAGRVNPSAFHPVTEITLLFALARSVNETIAVRRAVASERRPGRVVCSMLGVLPTP